MPVRVTKPKSTNNKLVVSPRFTFGYFIQMNVIYVWGNETGGNVEEDGRE